MDKEISDNNQAIKLLVNDNSLLEDRMMDVEMSASGAHRMIGDMKEEIRDLSDLTGNLNNQMETMQVEGIDWCRSRISVLEKPNNPANKSLWQLINALSLSGFAPFHVLLLVVRALPEPPFTT